MTNFNPHKQTNLRVLLTSISSSIVLAACSTNPKEAASIQYYLPSTNASVQSSLTLTKCSGAIAKTGAVGNLEASSKVNLVTTAGRQTAPLFVNGADLKKASAKRSLTIELNDKSVIKSINSENTNKTPAIIGGILKSATALLPLAGAAASTAPTNAYKCTQFITDVISRVASLKTELDKQRKRLPSHVSNGNSAEDVAKNINGLAKEIAHLQSTHLRANTKAKLAMNKKYPPTTVGSDLLDTKDLDFSIVEIKKKNWFAITGVDTCASKLTTKEQKKCYNDELQKLIKNLFGMKYSTDEIAVTPVNAITSSKKPKSLKTCRVSLKLPKTQDAKISVTLSGRALIQKNSQITQIVPIAQWPDPEELCLDVRFAESRIVKLAYDDFGRKKSFTWTSEAQAATAAEAIAGYSTSAATLFASEEEQTDVQKQQAEILRLETKQKFNKLKECEAIIEAGGYDCGQD